MLCSLLSWNLSRSLDSTCTRTLQPHGGKLLYCFCSTCQKIVKLVLQALACCTSVGHEREKTERAIYSYNPPRPPPPLYGISPYLLSREVCLQEKCLKSFTVAWSLKAIGGGHCPLQGEFCKQHSDGKRAQQRVTCDCEWCKGLVGILTKGALPQSSHEGPHYFTEPLLGHRASAEAKLSLTAELKGERVVWQLIRRGFQKAPELPVKGKFRNLSVHSSFLFQDFSGLGRNLNLHQNLELGDTSLTGLILWKSNMKICGICLCTEAFPYSALIGV